MDNGRGEEHGGHQNVVEMKKLKIIKFKFVLVHQGLSNGYGW